MDLLNGLVGYWPLDRQSFDQATHQFADKSGEENHGTGTGTGVGGTFDFSRDAHCVSVGATPFDHSNDIITCAHNSGLNITGDITITVWIKPSAVGVYNCIMGKSTNADYDLGIIPDSPNEIRLHSGNGVTQEHKTSVGADVTIDTWHHIAVSRTVSPNEATFYSNGAALNTIAYTLTPVGSATDVYIGARTGNLYGLEGDMSDIRLYNRALTQDEITQIYLERAGAYETVLIPKVIKGSVRISKERSLKV